MSVDLSRRSFFGALPAAVTAVKKKVEQLVSEAAAKEMAQVVGLYGSSVAGAGSRLGPLGGKYGHLSPIQKKILFLKKAGLLPDWFKRQERRNSRFHVYQMDPDLAALKSMSVSVKRAIQMERTYQRHMEDLEQAWLDEVAERVFTEECLVENAGAALSSAEHPNNV